MRCSRTARHLVLSSAMVLVGCMDGGWDNEDVGPDADADSDVDADVDVDADADGDCDADCEPDDSREGPGFLDGDDNDLCDNGVDDDRDGLEDCADLGCRNAVRCCEEVPDSWVEGELGSCVDLAQCGWTSFESSVGAVRLSPGAGVGLGGDGYSEVGFYSGPLAGLTGQPVLSFVASLDPDLCTEESCRHAVGVALSEGPAPTPGTGVVPVVGLVLDGELGRVHLFVDGRVDRSVELGIEALTSPRAYAVSVGETGAVQLWVDQDPAPSGERPAFGDGEGLTAAQRLAVERGGLRVVVFGRLEGDSPARVESVRLHRRLCDSPSDFSRVGSGPVHAEGGPGGRAGRPAVVATDDGYLMIFEGRGRLGAATSADGASWTSRELDLPPRTSFDAVAQRAPTIVRWAPGDRSPVYHLWYEGTAEVGQDTLEGVTPTAILHAVSVDGLRWEAAEDLVALRGVGSGDSAATPQWRYEVHDPAVAVLGDGGLGMWFVGRNPSSGSTAIGFQSSADGVEWVPWSAPVTFEPAAPAEFEQDGVARPTVVVRNGVTHMWYEGVRGSRTAIGYAASAGFERWQRFGVVLEPAEPWEEGRIGGPSVLVRRAAPSVDEIELWYHAGAPGREQVGLAARYAPGD